MTHIIGIDIAKRTFDVATQQDNGKIRTKSGRLQPLSATQLLD